MKSINQFINEDSYQINESFLSGFDLSSVVILSSIFSALTSIGITVSGMLVRQFITSLHHSKTRGKKNNILMKLKELTRSIPDVEDKPALAVLNNPGEWDSNMLAELRRALYDKMTPEQIKEFEDLEKEYLKSRNRFYSV